MGTGEPNKKPGFILVISGPSGCGKSTICRNLLEDERVDFSVSVTTRKPREGELDGREYLFVDEDRFREYVDSGAFLEWKEVHGNCYGTLKEPVENALAEGRIYLVEIDVQGGEALKLIRVPGVFIFVAPPDLDTLRRRLVDRGTDTPEVIEQRMRKATWEMDHADLYDHIVVNQDLNIAIAEVRRLAGLAEKADV
ncbi:MAG: guanylate kinase [Planctomycetes bacterium]|jgi:guanylate kinase|nr:guanylate kinase [Planctomycetota bacterium]